MFRAGQACRADTVGLGPGTRATTAARSWTGCAALSLATSPATAQCCWCTPPCVIRRAPSTCCPRRDCGRRSSGRRRSRSDRCCDRVPHGCRSKACSPRINVPSDWWLSAGGGMTEDGGAPVRVWVDPQGPIYLEGPVELHVDGEPEPTVIERFRVAICACRHSGRYPLCDGSHRNKKGTAHGRPDQEREAVRGPEGQGHVQVPRGPHCQRAGLLETRREEVRERR